MKKIRYVLALAFLFSATTIFAQQEKQITENKIFNHMDVALNLGTTGIGFELATPVTDWVQLRTGFSFIPKFKPTINFDIQVGDDPATSQSKFEQMSSILEGMLGNEVNNSIDMKGVPNFNNWTFLVDVFPFKSNRHWHFTAGFYLGSSTVANAYNTTEDMPSLIAVDMYNNMYDYFVSEKYWDEPIYGDMFIDPDVGDALRDKLSNYGRMGVNMGEYSHDILNEKGEVVHKKGDKYLMTPDKNSMVKARVLVNKFKPYVGFGYGGRLLKNNDRAKVSFDCGVMMWGGTPSLVTHDGTDLIKDVDNVPGKVGDYADAISGLKVFPVLNLRLSYRLF
ncbi:MAG: hypothetical protein J6P96_05135 [Bacteroidaceae bacterium]|nr:hypothetical protein [Bacteroidaceae bacterium]